MVQQSRHDLSSSQCDLQTFQGMPAPHIKTGLQRFGASKVKVVQFGLPKISQRSTGPDTYPARGC